MVPGRTATMILLLRRTLVRSEFYSAIVFIRFPRESLA